MSAAWKSCDVGDGRAKKMVILGDNAPLEVSCCLIPCLSETVMGSEAPQCRGSTVVMPTAYVIPVRSDPSIVPQSVWKACHPHSRSLLICRLLYLYFPSSRPALR